MFYFQTVVIEGASNWHIKQDKRIRDKFVSQTFLITFTVTVELVCDTLRGSHIVMFIIPIPLQPLLGLEHIKIKAD